MLTSGQSFQVLAISPGIAVGRVQPVRRKDSSGAPVLELISEEQVPAELERVRSAIDKTRQQLTSLQTLSVKNSIPNMMPVFLMLICCWLMTVLCCVKLKTGSKSISGPLNMPSMIPRSISAGFLPIFKMNFSKSALPTSATSLTVCSII